MFGDDRGNMKNLLGSMAKTSGVSAAVEFMGVSEILEDYYQASNFLLAPAIDEGFGRVLIEAMYYGCVVIATDSGGHREAIQKNLTGFLVEQGDSKAMMQIVLDCILFPSRVKNIVYRAHTLARDRISFQDGIDDLIVLYKKALF